MSVPARPLASIVPLRPLARAQGEKGEPIDDRPELFVTRKAKTDARVLPTPLRNRARAAYRATSYAEGDNTWSHFVAKAIEAETARREAEHNKGEMYPSWGENLPGGRRLKES